MNLTQALEICLNPVNFKYIREGRELQDDHKVHVTGDGYKEKISQFKGYENTKDFAIKKEMARPITTHLYKIIIDEQNRWLNSEVTKNYYWKTTSPEIQYSKSQSLEKYLSKVWKGQSIETFMRDFVKDALYSEFNGFVFVERTPVVIDELGNTTPGTPYVIFIPISQVHDFNAEGNQVTYFAYRMGKDPEGNDQIRIVDDETDMLLVKVQDKWTLKDSMPNPLGYVPAVQISTRTKDLLVDEIRTSYVDASITVADTYLSLYFEYIATCIRHGYPIQYVIAQRCNYEDKTRGLKCENGELGIDPDTGELLKCPKCNGTGRATPRDSGDIILIPQLDAQGGTWNNTAPGGYISSPVDTIKQQMEVLLDHENKIFVSCLGTKDLNKTNFQTATEALINSKSLENINNNIAANIEFIWEFVVTTIATYLDSENFAECRIRISRRFNLRQDNVILEEIKKGKECGASYTYLYELGKELIYARYSQNPEVLRRMLTLYRLEPYPFMTVSEMSDPFKTNFYECISLLEEDEKMPIEVTYEKFGHRKTLEKLKGYNTFVPADQGGSTPPEEL
jgi:hypothetical protein